MIQPTATDPVCQYDNGLQRKFVLAKDALIALHALYSINV